MGLRSTASAWEEGRRDALRRGQREAETVRGRGCEAEGKAEVKVKVKAEGKDKVKDNEQT